MVGGAGKTKDHLPTDVYKVNQTKGEERELGKSMEIGNVWSEEKRLL